jgi:hypothetical protein
MAEVERKQVGWAGLYDSEEALRAAAACFRDAGCKRWDCHTPYPVHGLDEAMGLKPSRLPMVTIGSGFVGLAVALALTYGLAVIQYPLRTAGKSLFSWPAFVPIYFELFVLFAALATMGSIIFFCKLGKWHSPLHDSNIMKEVTGHRFAIVVDSGDAKYEAAEQLFRDSGCEDIRPLMENQEEGMGIQ